MWIYLFAYHGPSDSGHAFYLIRANKLEDALSLLSIEIGLMWELQLQLFHGTTVVEPAILWDFEYSNPNYEG